MHVHEGEQPFYYRKHRAMTGAGHTSAFTIGRKLPDGTLRQQWIFENGLVCEGDDFEHFAVEIIKQIG